jgi:nucleolar protein 56
MVPGRRGFLRLAGGAGSVVVAGCGSGGSTPAVEVPASASSDEPISIDVRGVAPHARVTLRSRARDRAGTEWVANAVFETGPDGTVTVGKQRPIDGRYYDRADPMGLFWSMRPTGVDPTETLPPDVRFVPPEPTFDVTLAVEMDGRTLAETTTTRVLYDPGVERVATGPADLVGAAFLPPGEGPAPGVIHLHGAGGTPFYGLARQLASRGFATLALQYFGEPEPLPDSLVEVPVEYVERAISWFRGRERVADGGIGLFGFSRGGPLALLAAALSDAIGAVVGWVPSGVVYEGLGPGRSPAGASAWTIDGEPVPYLELAAADLGPPPTPGLPLFEPPLENASRGRLEAVTIPVEAVDAPIYLASATDDRRWPSPELCRRAIDRLDGADFRHAYRHDAFGGAGHFLFPPFLPTAGTTRNSTHRFGGNPAANARANAAAWARTRSFLARSLPSQ